jgi:hypothetical protein
MTPCQPDRASNMRPVFKCGISERTGTVFRRIVAGDVDVCREKAALLKALRIERERPTRPQRAQR